MFIDFIALLKLQLLRLIQCFFIVARDIFKRRKIVKLGKEGGEVFLGISDQALAHFVLEEAFSAFVAELILLEVLQVVFRVVVFLFDLNLLLNFSVLPEDS